MAVIFIALNAYSFADEPYVVPATAREMKSVAVTNMLEKLMGDSDKEVSIGLLTPTDATNLNLGEVSENTITSALSSYEIKVSKINYSLESLTMQAFRRVCVRHNLDVVLVTVLKPTNFDLFLFDRRTPYRLYAYSDLLPVENQYRINAALVEEHSKVLVRRVLYAYMQNQYYELPREEGTTIDKAEIPRWIASRQTFETVNRELTSSFYFAGGVGAALVGREGQTWNSNAVSVEVGYKVADHLFLEGGINSFSYNAFTASMKYLYISKDSPIKMIGGLGVASLTNKHTLNFDENLTLGTGGVYVVPSFGILFPITDVHISLEAKVFKEIGGGGTVFMMMPGVFFLF